MPGQYGSRKYWFSKATDEHFFYFTVSVSGVTFHSLTNWWYRFGKTWPQQGASIHISTLGNSHQTLSFQNGWIALYTVDPCLKRLLFPWPLGYNQKSFAEYINLPIPSRCTHISFPMLLSFIKAAYTVPIIIYDPSQTLIFTILTFHLYAYQHPKDSTA